MVRGGTTVSGERSTPKRLSDEEVVTFARERYSDNYALMVADVLRVPSSFSRHIRNSLIREMSKDLEAKRGL